MQYFSEFKSVHEMNTLIILCGIRLQRNVEHKLFFLIIRSRYWNDRVYLTGIVYLVKPNYWIVGWGYRSMCKYFWLNENFGYFLNDGQNVGINWRMTWASSIYNRFHVLQAVMLIGVKACFSLLEASL